MTYEWQEILCKRNSYVQFLVTQKTYFITIKYCLLIRENNLQGSVMREYQVSCKPTVMLFLLLVNSGILVGRLILLLPILIKRNELRSKKVINNIDSSYVRPQPTNNQPPFYLFQFETIVFLLDAKYIFLFSFVLKQAQISCIFSV